MRGRPTETYRFQDGDSIVTVSIARMARPRGEIGHKPDRSTIQADELSAMVADFVRSTAANAKYRLPAIELPSTPNKDF